MSSIIIASAPTSTLMGLHLPASCTNSFRVQSRFGFDPNNSSPPFKSIKTPTFYPGVSKLEIHRTRASSVDSILLDLGTSNKTLDNGTDGSVTTQVMPIRRPPPPPPPPEPYSEIIGRSSFPTDFLFGAGSAAYQYEGSPLKYGRGPCIWDKYVSDFSDKISDGSNADIANDFYHKFREDIKLMKYVGLDTFRFSISWTRIFPRGKISGGVNPPGIKFYNDLIDELIANGIKPFATLLHFDCPQALEEEYGGPLSSNFVKDFTEFADFCYDTLGDRVKYWATVNEPNLFAVFGYGTGLIAPARCSSFEGTSIAGDSATEPYRVAHNLLLSHAAAGTLYKEKYQATQKGQVGISPNTFWYEPLHNTPEDAEAAATAVDFWNGWFLHPLIYGDYPPRMRQLVGDRLPRFSPKQSEMLTKSFDYITINYYNAMSTSSTPQSNLVSYSTDGRFTTSNTFDYPEGLQKLLVHIKEKYKNPTIYISENGTTNSGSVTEDVAVKDITRISYVHDHLSYLLKAIKDDGVNVKGYYLWTFLDDWEWGRGFSQRYGIVYVDTNTLERNPKASAYWYKKFLST